MTPAASWLESLTVPAVFAVTAVATQAVSLPGAAGGYVLAVVVYLGAGRGGFATLAAFVILGSGATRLGYRVKAARGIAQTDRGRRSAAHAAANLAVPAVLAVLLLVYGPAAWLAGGFVGALATATCDTLGTEIGQLASRRPWTFLPLRRVPPGTPGALSFAGTGAGAGGALVVALVATAGSLLAVRQVWIPVLAAVSASFLESIVRQRPSHRLSGHACNLLNTLAGALLASLWTGAIAR